MIPRPDSGQGPKEAGDRGGALQLLVFGLVVVAIGSRGDEGRARLPSGPTLLAPGGEGVAGADALEEPGAVGVEAGERGADADVAVLSTSALRRCEEERDHRLVEVAGGEMQQLLLAAVDREPAVRVHAGVAVGLQVRGEVLSRFPSRTSAAYANWRASSVATA